MNDRKWTALRITLVYLLFGTLWILFSDKAFDWFMISPDRIIQLSTIKGCAYVLVTGALIYLLVYTHLKRIMAMEEELSQQNRELNETQKKLHHMAYYDYLTGLPNRMSLYENFKAFKDIPGARCAMLTIDIDNFKNINDTMGYSFGDELIKAIGGRIAGFYEDRYVLYRMDSDEFTIGLHNLISTDQVRTAAEIILNLMEEPFKIRESSFYVSLSIGIALFPEQGHSADELLKNSEIALHKAKEGGKNRYIIFDEAMKMAVTERMTIEKNLRSALGNEELLLYYQPQLDLRKDRITGFEALLRWKNPELGFVPPNRFIGIAEETHLIISIGKWVLRNACIFLKRLHDMGCSDLDMAVNISIIQLMQEDFVENVTMALESAGLDPRFLELEITESVVIESYETIGEKLDRLRGMGVKIALDDFGTGYSSLNVLQSLKIDILKIDKGFIDNILISEERALVENIIMIGRKMGLIVLAEGVETIQQLEYLKRFACHKMQGYYFSRPLPEDEVIRLLKADI